MLIKALRGGLVSMAKPHTAGENPSQARVHVTKRNKVWLEDKSGRNTCQLPVDTTTTVDFVNSQQESEKHLSSLAYEK